MRSSSSDLLLHLTLVQVTPSRASSLKRREFRKPRTPGRPSAILSWDPAAVRLVRVSGATPVQQLTRSGAVVDLLAARAHASGGVVGAALPARSHKLQVCDGFRIAPGGADLGVLLREKQTLRVAALSCPVDVPDIFCRCRVSLVGSLMPV